MCLKQNSAYIFFIYTHTDAPIILSIPPSRHNHTQADNSVSQGASSLTLWPPPDRGSSWTGTHGCLELTSPGELEGEESLFCLGEWPAELPQISMWNVLLWSCVQEGLRRMSRPWTWAAAQGFFSVRVNRLIQNVQFILFVLVCEHHLLSRSGNWFT